MTCRESYHLVPSFTTRGRRRRKNLSKTSSTLCVPTRLGVVLFGYHFRVVQSMNNLDEEARALSRMSPEERLTYGTMSPEKRTGAIRISLSSETDRNMAEEYGYKKEQLAGDVRRAGKDCSELVARELSLSCFRETSRDIPSHRSGQCDFWPTRRYAGWSTVPYWKVAFTRLSVPLPLLRKGRTIPASFMALHSRFTAQATGTGPFRPHTPEVPRELLHRPAANPYEEGCSCVLLDNLPVSGIQLSFPFSWSVGSKLTTAGLKNSSAICNASALRSFRSMTR